MKFIHRPNEFPERKHGPFACDIQGEQNVTIDGEDKKVYFFACSQSPNSHNLSDLICGYFDYNEDGTLNEECKNWLSVNKVFEALGLPDRKPDASTAIKDKLAYAKKKFAKSK